MAPLLLGVCFAWFLVYRLLVFPVVFLSRFLAMLLKHVIYIGCFAIINLLLHGIRNSYVFLGKINLIKEI